jgi:hypothetical protein
MYAYVGWYVCMLVTFRFSLLLHRTVCVLPLATTVGVLTHRNPFQTYPLAQLVSYPFQPFSNSKP